MEENTSRRAATISVGEKTDRIVHFKSSTHRVEYVSGGFVAVVNKGPNQLILYRDVLPDVVEVVDVQRNDEGKTVGVRSHEVKVAGGPSREDVVTLILTDSALKTIHDVLSQHLEVINRKEGERSADQSTDQE